MNIALTQTEILLPAKGVDLQKWAVVACDQFTAQPDYWNKVEAFVGDAPSALKITLPEIYLKESETRIPKLQQTMRDYLDTNVLVPAVHGFVLVERETSCGTRLGLVAAIDLDYYDYAKGSQTLIRATEGTVAERVPPRAKIRMGAALEAPHVMMLIDDKKKTVIEPLTQKNLHKLYDFELMQSGGNIKGYAVEGEDAEAVIAALEKLGETCDGMLYAVGDGNHSLAAAKQCWTNIRATLDESERLTHPARFALVELVNIACDALVFEPIYRVVFGAGELMNELKSLEKNVPDEVTVFNRDERFVVHCDLRSLQAFLDEYIKTHSDASIDYIHGSDALKSLVDNNQNAVGIMPQVFDKYTLFDYVRNNGTLPRKAFSMGEANEKRYYMETRKITL